MSGFSIQAVAAPAASSALAWAIERPTPGVVLIDVEIAGPKSLAPLHWRAGDWTKPPLDIEVNPVVVPSRAFRLCFQDEQVPEGTPRVGYEGAVGIPLVDVEGWPEDRYRDIRCPVEVTRATTGELVATLGGMSAISYAGLPGGMVMGGTAPDICVR